MEFKESIGFRKSKTAENGQSVAEVGKRVPEIKNPEMAQLEEPMKKILQGMSEHIDKGEYGVILGEDASGRLPALLFWRILKTLYKEKGLPSPETRFFAGQRIGEPAQREKVIKDFVNFIEKSGAKEIAENKKILVVTDTLRTGEHIKYFMEALRKLKISFDIATISLVTKSEETTKKHRKYLEDTLGGKIFWGREYGPAFCKTISGVKKSDEPSLFAEQFPPMEALKGTKKYYSQVRASARQDIKILAEKLTQWYKEKNSE